jgi:hypothetical protein
MKNVNPLYMHAIKMLIIMHYSFINEILNMCIIEEYRTQDLILKILLLN